jgi:hypothetical protein
MKNVSMSTDGGKTWKAIAEKAGGMGCILSFADARTGLFGSGAKFQMTKDGVLTLICLAPQSLFMDSSKKELSFLLTAQSFGLWIPPVSVSMQPASV